MIAARPLGESIPRPLVASILIANNLRSPRAERRKNLLDFLTFNARGVATAWGAIRGEPFDVPYISNCAQRRNDFINESLQRILWHALEEEIVGSPEESTLRYFR